MPVLICTTCFTPGTAFALSALNDAGLPPNTGQRTTRATSMPGRLTSMPNSAVPFTFAGTSRRGSGCPRTRNAFGSLSTTFAGTGTAAARSTSAPYFRRRPLAACTTSPFSVVTVSSATLHVCAAAVTSIARALAPASRSRRHMPRVLLLPAVVCDPPKLGLP